VVSCRVLTGLVAAGVLAAGLSCGHGAKRNPAAPQVSVQKPPVTLDAVLQSIDAYQPPKNVDKATFAALKLELKRELTARATVDAGGKKVLSAPIGPQNAVSDLTADNNGWGTESSVKWTEVLQGDYNNDGSVDVGDLAPVAQFYMQRTDGGPDDGHKLIVGDPDPEINIADLQAIAANYAAHIEGYQVWRGHWNGTATDWESNFRPPSDYWHQDVSKPRPTGAAVPVYKRPAYYYYDNIALVADKDNIRYKVAPYGDGAAGAESNEAAVPPIPTYMVSGTVLEGATPLPGVTMTLTPGPLTATTQADGTFSISGAHYGSYTLTPAKAGTAFTPASRTVVVFGADMPGQDFTAVQGHTISGTIQESGTGLGGVVVTLTPGPLTATTQADGAYAISDVSSGTYTVVPRTAQYAFTPPTRTAVVGSADVSGMDFAGVGGQAALAWPKFRGNLKNTGLSPYVGAQTGSLRWTYPTGGLCQNSPAIGPDGTVYIGGFVQSGAGYAFYAVSPSDGSLKWSFNATSEGSMTTPAVSADGTVYVGTGNPDGYAYALNPLDGSIKWKRKLSRDTVSSPAIGPDGTVYFGSEGSGVYALNPADGTVIRRFSTGDYIESSPAVGDDGTLYIGCDDGKVYAFNTSDGTQKWTYQTGREVVSSAAIGADGTIFVGSTDGSIYALNPADGSLKWQYATGGGVVSSPAIGADGTVYVGGSDASDNMFFWALNAADGGIKWTYTGHSYFYSSAAVGADGTVYFCTEINVCALNGTDGTVKWSLATDIAHSSPAIAADGTVYAAAGVDFGGLYAFFP